MNCGIIGLPNVGKTALFNLLTENNALSSNYPYCTVEPNTGIAKAKDLRVDKLGELFSKAALIYPSIKFVDVAGLPPGAADGEGLGNQFLSTIRNVDALLHVVRNYNAPQVSRFDSSESYPQNDFDLVMTELFLADLEIAKRRLKEEPKSEYWKDTSDKLERKAIPEQDEEKVLLSPKPQIVILNITSGKEKIHINNDKIIYIDVLYHQDLAQLTLDERKPFLEDASDWESGIDDILENVKKLLGLITFYTIVGGLEIKGHNIPEGSTAYEAAGKIHSDMQKGFIRAKVFNYDDLENFGYNFETLKEKGITRTEGKDYKIIEGDILEILFK